MRPDELWRQGEGQENRLGHRNASRHIPVLYKAARAAQLPAASLGTQGNVPIAITLAEEPRRTAAAAFRHCLLRRR